jgi:hypothetical protein
MERVFVRVNDTEHFIIISAVSQFIHQKTGLLPNDSEIAQSG